MALEKLGALQRALGSDSERRAQQSIECGQFASALLQNGLTGTKDERLKHDILRTLVNIISSTPRVFVSGCGQGPKEPGIWGTPDAGCAEPSWPRGLQISQICAKGTRSRSQNLHAHFTGIQCGLFMLTRLPPSAERLGDLALSAS